jgi:hypothetical protein
MAKSKLVQAVGWNGAGTEIVSVRQRMWTEIGRLSEKPFAESHHAITITERQRRRRRQKDFESSVAVRPGRQP